MNILLTGGAGFIGSHVAERLLAQGHEITVLDDFNDYYNPEFKHQNVADWKNHPKFRLVTGDIAVWETVFKTFQRAKPDMVIHLAARAGVRPSVQDPFLYQRVNVRGTLNILESMRQTGVKKLTFGSTSSVYGINSKVPFSESDLVQNTISPYAATKLAGEALCRSYSHLYGIDTVVLRFFSVYGPRGRPDMAIYQFTQKIITGKPIPMFGDGSSERDYTHVDDIVQGVLATVDQKFGFEICNLGESETISLRDMIAEVEKSVGRKATIDRLPEQPGDVPRTYADISKSWKLLGYRPRIKVDEGIPLFVEWFRKNRM